MTEMMVHFAGGLHRLAILDFAGRRSVCSLPPSVRRSLQPRSVVDRRRRGRTAAVVELTVGRPMETVSDATDLDRTLGPDLQLGRTRHWPRRSRRWPTPVSGRFADADNDTESTILSARRADSGDPFVTVVAVGDVAPRRAR